MYACVCAGNTSKKLDMRIFTENSVSVLSI